MAFQREVGSGSNRATDYRDGTTKWITMMTSRHMELVVINAGGTGYVVGEVITVTHAGAYLDFRAEVMAESAGVVTELLITSSGAFADRIASVAVDGGGTGYSVGEILEIQGGSSREPGKAIVDTESAGVITAVSVFETGGVYSTPPGLSGAATLGIGPNAFAGDDAATLDLTMTGIVGDTALATTASASGTGLTVDVTLVESGWSVDGRNTNSYVNDTFTDEKTCVLVGDAAGRTNKPYVAFQTSALVTGPDTRYATVIFAMAAHNPAIPIHLQANISPVYNVSTGALANNIPQVLWNENQVQENDFWITVDDTRAAGVVNINPGAGTTDDGKYFQWHTGLLDIYGTELEQPYSMFTFGSAILIQINPDLQNTLITSMAEMMGAFGAANSSGFFFSPQDVIWYPIINTIDGTLTARSRIMYPMGRPFGQGGSPDGDSIAGEGPLETWADWSTLNRGSSANLLLPVFSDSQPQIFLWPLNVMQKFSTPLVGRDGPIGEVRGVYWLSATDENGDQITNFSEDFITIGTGPGSRYRVFHNHVHTDRYQYIAIREDV